MNSAISNQKDTSEIVLKLVYFWAFIEAGLGGLLHLLHIPFTGFVVGGFAIIIIVLLAKFGNNKAIVIIKAMGVVLAVKFFLSPYTPVGAYVAVCFQGLLAVVLFSIFGLKGISIFLFAIVVMIESALQKPLMAYFIYGKEFWNTAIALISDTFTVSQQKVKNAGLTFMTIYTLLYILWGIVLARWSNYLRMHIQDLKVETLVFETAITNSQNQQLSSNKKRKYTLLFLLLVIVPLLAIPIVTGTFTYSYLIRTVILLLLFFIIVPFLIKKHQGYLLSNNKKLVNDIVTVLPQIKSKTLMAWQLASPYKGVSRLKQFVTLAIWLNVFYSPPENA